jgi:hypothetical protein
MRRSQQVERFERRRWPLEIHANCGHVVLNNRVVSRRVRVGVSPPHRGRGVPLQAPIGPTRCKTRERLIGRDGASNGGPVRSGMRLASRRCLSFRDEHQTRHEDSQRGCDLSDRG